MKRNATAVWNGSGKEGSGNLTTQSTVLNKTQFSYNTRFGDGIGTNPEELVAAAHAGCFTMAVSYTLSGKGLTATSLDTEAIVSMDNAGITGIYLSITGNVPGINADEFEAITKDAEKNCLISKVLNTLISSEAHLIY